MGASQKVGELSCTLGDRPTIAAPRSTLRQKKRRLSPLPSLPAFGRSGLVGPPLCGGSAPATPPLNHAVPHRPGADIRNRCLFERVQPDHVPPAPSDPLTCPPSACPRTRPNCRTPPSGQAWLLRCVSPKDGIQRQPPLARIPRHTVLTPNLRCTPASATLDTTQNLRKMESFPLRPLFPKRAMEPYRPWHGASCPPDRKHMQPRQSLIRVSYIITRSKGDPEYGIA